MIFKRASTGNKMASNIGNTKLITEDMGKLQFSVNALIYFLYRRVQKPKIKSTDSNFHINIYFSMLLSLICYLLEFSSKVGFFCIALVPQHEAANWAPFSTQFNHVKHLQVIFISLRLCHVSIKQLQGRGTKLAWLPHFN